MIWGSGGSKSRLAKAAGAEPVGQMRDEKLHAVVARSTFPSQNAQNTSGADHFWKLRCRKSARRCGAKYISKSKRTKHTIVGPLLEVAMSKKCTPLWREAQFPSQNVHTYRHTDTDTQTYRHTDIQTYITLHYRTAQHSTAHRTEEQNRTYIHTYICMYICGICPLFLDILTLSGPGLPPSHVSFSGARRLQTL